SSAPSPPAFPCAGLGNHRFHCPRAAHPPLRASYLVSVRRVVAVAPASFRPRLTTTPLPSLNGSGSLDRTGLSPPRAGTCPAYREKQPPVGGCSLGPGWAVWLTRAVPRRACRASRSSAR